MTKIIAFVLMNGLFTLLIWLSSSSVAAFVSLLLAEMLGAMMVIFWQVNVRSKQR